MKHLKSKANILLFDGVCNFCNTTVIFLLKRDHKGEINYASLQSDIGHELLAKYNLTISENPESAVFIKKGKIYLKSSAAIEVLRTIGGIYKSAIILKIIPAPIRDFFYDIISKNRYRWFGQRAACIVPDKEMQKRFLK